jgi:hypothetical protein
VEERRPAHFPDREDPSRDLDGGLLLLELLLGERREGADDRGGSGHAAEERGGRLELLRLVGERAGGGRQDRKSVV